VLAPFIPLAKVEAPAPFVKPELGRCEAKNELER
jgi:hypothetical protein